MRKRVKKLTLNRETLRSLEARNLRGAAGGTDTTSFNTSCACRDITGCECATQGGTDCYPATAAFGTCSPC